MMGGWLRLWTACAATAICVLASPAVAEICGLSLTSKKSNLVSRQQRQIRNVIEQSSRWLLLTPLMVWHLEEALIDLKYLESPKIGQSSKRERYRSSRHVYDEVAGFTAEVKQAIAQRVYDLTRSTLGVDSTAEDAHSLNRRLLLKSRESGLSLDRLKSAQEYMRSLDVNPRLKALTLSAIQVTLPQLAVAAKRRALYEAYRGWAPAGLAVFAGTGTWFLGEVALTAAWLSVAVQQWVFGSALTVAAVGAIVWRGDPIAKRVERLSLWLSRHQRFSTIDIRQVATIEPSVLAMQVGPAPEPIDRNALEAMSTQLTSLESADVSNLGLELLDAQMALADRLAKTEQMAAIVEDVAFELIEDLQSSGADGQIDRRKVVTYVVAQLTDLQRQVASIVSDSTYVGEKIDQVAEALRTVNALALASPDSSGSTIKEEVESRLTSLQLDLLTQVRLGEAAEGLAVRLREWSERINRSVSVHVARVAELSERATAVRRQKLQ